MPKPHYEYEVIATVGASTFEYVDTDADLSGSAPTVKYRVDAIDGGSSLGFTNTVETEAILPVEKQLKESQSNPIKGYSLKENYPNPFNPTTTITYTIPEKQDVKIRVYDPFGREVAELVNEVKAKGEHSVNFDGSNLASGVYYYTITAGNYTETKKLMLIK